MRASVTGPSVSTLFASSVPPPRSCFCPQSTPGRCIMGSDEDRSVNLGTRSHAWCCSRICDLTGPSSRRWDLSADIGIRCRQARCRLAFLGIRLSWSFGVDGSGGRRRTAGESESLAGPEHPVQHHRQLARQRHLRLFHARALGDGQRPALQRRALDRARQDDVRRLVRGRRARRDRPLSRCGRSRPSRRTDTSSVSGRNAPRPSWTSGTGPDRRSPPRR